MNPKLLFFLKCLAITYGIHLLGLIILIILHNRHFEPTQPFFWILPFLFAFTGTFIGHIVSWLKDSLHAGRFYIGGGLTAFVLFITLILHAFFSDKEKDPDEHIKDNARFFETRVTTDKGEKRIAFERLVADYIPPREINLQGITTLAIRDTMINGFIEPIYRIRFLYYKNDKRDLYKAVADVWRNDAHVLLYNQFLTYHEIVAKDSAERAAFGEFKKVWKQVPDSMKQEIEKEIKMHIPD